MASGQPEEQETIGALLARLVENGRAVVKAELVLFRTDFYRRLARARLGAVLVLSGAIMGQAAAVTFLVTLSFVLQPLLGRLGAAAVSVLLGIVAAVALIRIGARKLILVVEDPEDDDDLDTAAIRSPVDELFERMRERSRAARNELVDTVGEAQARLHPQALVADFADMVVDRAQEMSHRAIDAVRERPFRSAAAAMLLALLLIRPPIYKIIATLGRATRRNDASLKDEPAGSPATGDDEETRS